MIPVTILDEAKNELLEAIDFYESRCTGLGLDFEREIKVADEMIQEFPERWPHHHDDTRRYLIHRFPYIIVYLYYMTISGSSLLHIASESLNIGMIDSN